MSKADTLQMRHNIKGALRERLKAIAHRSAGWHDYHQAGVLLSELAEIWWQATRHRTAEKQHELLHRAASYMDHALKLLEEEHPNKLAESAIACDIAILMARQVRAVNNHELAHEPLDLLVPDGGMPSLQQQLSQTAATLPLKERQPYLHQAAIAGMMVFRLQCGPVFGFLTELDAHSATKTQNDTLGRFQGMLDDASPDKEQAYRSFLLHAAIFEESQDDWLHQHMFAAAALGSAWQFRDIPHAVCALAILMGGRRAYRALSMLRLAKEML